MVHKKSGSHRQSLKDKYKIIKKVKEHRKKLNKLSKDNPGKKLKKDPGVPNLWPFKEKLIKEAEDHREQQEEMRRSLREKRLSAIARARNRSNKQQEAPKEEKYQSLAEQNFVQRRWYYRELKKVIDQADVILEVVDARDPQGCRCLEIERRIQAMSGEEQKKLVIVINKIDLVPPDVATKWVSHFRREFPTIAFKASTQQQANNLSQKSVKLNDVDESDLSKSSSLGAGALMSLLKNYARSIGSAKKTITVGCVGFPNVGKSSIINSLKRSKAVSVSSTAGHTKTLQTVKVDHNISIIDSPGVLFADADNQADLVLRSCLRIEQMEDPLGAVVKLVSKVPAESLMEIYRISTFKTPQEFVSHVAHKRGKLKAGGVPNLTAASVTILKDWTSGAIPFYTLPPAASKQDAHHESKTIVSGWGADFDQLLDANQAELATIDRPANPLATVMQASEPLAMENMGEEGEDGENDALEDDEDDEGMEDDDEGMQDDDEEEEEEAAPALVKIDMKKATKKKKGSVAPLSKTNKKAAAPSTGIAASQQRNKSIKKSQKSTKKKLRREAAAAATAMAE